MKIATRDGVDLHVRIDGSDHNIHRPLVLSNSLGTDLHLWDSLVARMAATRRIVRYDQRGHGSSAVPPGPYTNVQLAADVIDILDKFEFRKADFCGLSMGGMAGQWLAAHHPERFGRLVFANTAPVMDMDEVWNARIAAVNRGGMTAIVDSVLERWFTPHFRQTDPEAVARIRAMLETTDPAGYAACCAAVRDLDVRTEAARIISPVLVIAGAQDKATPPELGRAIAAAIPQADYVELDTAHLSNIEQPESFEKTVIDFLDR